MRCDVYCVHHTLGLCQACVGEEVYSIALVPSSASPHKVSSTCLPVGAYAAQGGGQASKAGKLRVAPNGNVLAYRPEAVQPLHTAQTCVHGDHQALTSYY